MGASCTVNYATLIVTYPSDICFPSLPHSPLTQLDGALFVVPILTPMGDVVGTLNVDTLCDEDLADGSSSDPTIEPHEQNFHQVGMYVVRCIITYTCRYMVDQWTRHEIRMVVSNNEQCSCLMCEVCTVVSCVKYVLLSHV